MTAPTRSPSAAARVSPLDVLVVGTTNICRSPAVERLLRARLGPDDGVTVTTAGTRAVADHPVPDPMTTLLAEAGASVDGHTARRLTSEMVAAADLVLTLTRDERADVVRRVPAAVRRTFTLRELARVATTLEPGTLPDAEPVVRLRALVDAAAVQRGLTAPDAPADDDVLDPYGQDEEAYTESFDQLRRAVDHLVAAVRPAAPGTADDEPPAERLPLPVRRRRSRARTVALVAGTSVAVLVGAVTAGALVVVDRLDDRIERFPDPFADLPTRPAPAPDDGTGDPAERPVTVLVLGSAGDVVGAGPADWREAAAMTDVVMLVRVSGDRRSAQVVAMPPDLQVDVAGAGPGPLRSAFALGGPPRAVQTVEQLTDVRLDHVALTDSSTFVQVTDTLGGVDLDLVRDLVVDGRVVARMGERRLDGDQALAWVQQAGPAVEARAARQQAWLSAILARLGDGEVRRSPTAWLELLGVVSGSVAVDEGFDREEMVGLLTSARGLRPGDVDVVTVPTTVGRSAAGEPVLLPDQQPFDALMDALRRDRLAAELAADRVGG